ncbi:hypothetical protein FLK61_37330 [Paenalkalicoccus suaedae]|uniref:Uncharacterized protein n=1 Tax=Paenalkalicoccus suaedae TaxID=2592382 RepID=A0A859FHN3_9BACI|nr:hypothetical protein [Paenalkalicoccus suaedae]QKS72300.1 hypothetical protein FLK61_37330 [Paenalkalicoccus suaedae]
MDSDHFSVNVNEAYSSYAQQEKLDYNSDQKVIAIPRTDNLSILTVDNESITEKDLEEMLTEHLYITVYIDYDASAHYHNELGEQEDPSYPVIESSVLIIGEPVM